MRLEQAATSGLKTPLSSPPRDPRVEPGEGSSKSWIPAFAGMTIVGFVLLLPSVLWCFAGARAAESSPAAEVWFAPGNDTPDLLDLFTHPALWPKARSHIAVFKLAPPQFEQPALLGALKRAGAFAALKSWNIALASEEGAIKDWDGTGAKAATVTLLHMRNARAAGGAIGYVAMDEPLVGGEDFCTLTLDETARRTAAYVKAVAADAGALGETVRIGDIEPYPSFDVAKLMQWTEALERNGYKPEFVHLDVNIHFVDLHPALHGADDLRTLRDFFRRQGIPFGVIFWSGYDPLNSDRAYYERTLRFVRQVKAAIGQPDQSVFQSWVTRSSVTCPGSTAACLAAKCTPADPPSCGKKSIPLNLPESDPRKYSHTRLIDDALRVLQER
jgi:hypothetical protein